MLLTHACILHNMTIGTGRAPAISTQRAFLTGYLSTRPWGWIIQPLQHLQVGENFFCVYFTLEIIIRFLAFQRTWGNLLGGWCYFATDRWGWYLVKVYPGISFLFSTLDVRVDIVFEMKFLRKCIVVTYATHVFTLRTLV